MAQIPQLVNISRMVVVQSLLGERESSVPGRDLQLYLIGLLRTNIYSAVSESILKKIVSEQPDRLTNEILLSVCPIHLRHLVIGSCTRLSTTGIGKTLDKCSKIHSLDMSRISLSGHDSFFVLFRGMEDTRIQLTSLSLEGVNSLTDHNVQCALRTFTNLKQLNVSCCDELTDKAFLIDEELQLSREAQAQAGGTLEWKSSLTSVDISGCHGLSSTAVRHITALCGPTLQHINISYSDIDSTALWYLSGYSLMSAIHMVHSLAKTLGHQVISDRDGTDKVLDELMVATEEVSQLIQKQHKTFENIESTDRAEMESSNTACSLTSGHKLANESIDLTSSEVMTQVLKENVADSLVSALTKYEGKPLHETLKSYRDTMTVSDNTIGDLSCQGHNKVRLNQNATFPELLDSEVEGSDIENTIGDKSVPYNYGVDRQNISQELFEMEICEDENLKMDSLREIDMKTGTVGQDASDCDDSSIPDPFMVVETKDGLIVPLDSFKTDDVSSRCESSASDYVMHLNLEASGACDISDDELEGAVGGFEPFSYGCEDIEYGACYIDPRDLELIEKTESEENNNEDDFIIDVIAMSNQPEVCEKSESQEMSRDDQIIDAIAMSNQPEVCEKSESQEMSRDDQIIDAIAMSNQPEVCGKRESQETTGGNLITSTVNNPRETLEPLESEETLNDDDLVIDAIAFTNQPKICADLYQHPYNSLESDRSSFSNDSYQSTSDQQYFSDDSYSEIYHTTSETSLLSDRVYCKENTFDRLAKVCDSQEVCNMHLEGSTAKDETFSKLRGKFEKTAINEKGDYCDGAQQTSDEDQYLFPKLKETAEIVTENENMCTETQQDVKDSEAQMQVVANAESHLENQTNTEQNQAVIEENLLIPDEIEINTDTNQTNSDTNQTDAGGNESILKSNVAENAAFVLESQISITKNQNCTTGSLLPVIIDTTVVKLSNSDSVISSNSNVDHTTECNVNQSEPEKIDPSQYENSTPEQNLEFNNQDKTACSDAKTSAKYNSKVTSEDRCVFVREVGSLKPSDERSTGQIAEKQIHTIETEICHPEENSAIDEETQRFKFKTDTPYYRSDSMRMVSHVKDFGFDLGLMKQQCDENSESSSDDVILSVPQAKFNDDGVNIENSVGEYATMANCDENYNNVLRNAKNEFMDVESIQLQLTDDYNELDPAHVSGDLDDSNTASGLVEQSINEIEEIVSKCNQPVTINCDKKTNDCISPDNVFQSSNVESCLTKISSKPDSKVPLKQRKCNTVRDRIQLFTPCLTSIDMSSIVCHSKELVKACVKALFLTNTNIQRLALSWTQLDDDLLQFIADHAPKLSRISLLDCEGLTSMGIAYLCTKCPTLTSLNLRGVCFISDFALVPLMNDRGVTHLNLAETNITDISLRSFATKCAQLTELDLSWCEEIMEENTDAMETLIQSGSSLQVFKLRHLPISENCLFSLAAHCVNLTRLNLSNVSMCDSHLLSISLRCKLLKDLDVSWNSALTDVGCGSVLSHLIFLEALNMSGIKQLSSQPFLPIISELSRWRKCQALLKFKQGERKVLREQDEDSSFSDEDYECLYLPCRSTVYAPCVHTVELHYSDKINDQHLAEIVAVCRGTIKIRDYYGDWVLPMLLPAKL